MAPGDVAFRIAGKSMGMFKGGWIGYQFKREIKNTYPDLDPKLGVFLQSIAVEAWSAESGGSWSVIPSKAEYWFRRKPASDPGQP